MNFLRFGLLIRVLAASVDNFQGDVVGCGTVNLFRELILGGNEVAKDEWPFIAALYNSKNLKYFCGGTIISNKHVLTAAHCIQGKFSSQKLSPDDITVRLGAYNLTSKIEPGVVDRKVTQIVVHPDWNVKEERYEADIAILVLSDKVAFSNNIRPICMPSDDVRIDGVKGTVVGWGVTENGTAEGIPRQTVTNALNDSYCYRQDHGISRYTSERSFCGGLGDGTPNKGDSGTGFFAIYGSTWVQYGTVSVVRANPTGHIVASSFAVYMNLQSYKNFISDTVADSGGAVSEATMDINLHCSYRHHIEVRCRPGIDIDVRCEVYGCWAHDLNIRNEHFVVRSITGLHELNSDTGWEETNEDVELLVFENGTIFFLPDKFGYFFPNLKRLTVRKDISQSTGTSGIRRSNFEYLKNLKYMELLHNDIMNIDEDTLWDLPNLESFQLNRNKLKVLHADTFSRNRKLRIVHVLNNALTFLPSNLFRSNSLLEEIVFDGNSLDTIDRRTFETNFKLQNISFKNNRLQSLNRDLLQNNRKLVLVDFSGNAIYEIDEQTFRTNSKLRAVSLGSNKLEFLPRNLFDNNSLLEVIILRMNSLKTVDEQLFQTNQRLSEISLYSNQLKVLPRNLLRNNFLLQKVDLGHNVLEEIDESSFESNHLLRNISLESNLLEHLPKDLFKRNTMLQFVNVRKNFLDAIDEHIFESNEQLEQVYFKRNYLEVLPVNLFKNNLLLEIVDIANNPLDAIDERTFQTNVKLREVYFTDDILDTLPANVFRYNPMLEVVDVSKNVIKEIDENIFEFNAKLQKVFLHSNLLTSLPRNLFRSNPLLRYVDLHGNQLKIIDTSFTVLNGVVYIDFHKNSCIDVAFHNSANDNLTQFQNLVVANCSSTS